MPTELPDANVLLAMHAPDHPFHEVASAWFAEGNRFATTPITENALLRLLMSDTVLATPLTSKKSLLTLQRLQQRSRWEPWHDSSLSISSVAKRALLGPKQVMDLSLINTAILNRGILVTFDQKLVAPLNRAERNHIRVLNVD